MRNADIRLALDELLNQRHLPLDDVLDRHFSPEYRQRTNGHWDDREAFSRHAQKLREVVASARIEVLDEIRDGNRYADRHRVHVTKHDGGQVVQEVYLFAELDAAGRFLRIEEATLMLEGLESDRGMGRMK
ncbi:MAG: nuclear transport factor 2 family protein [Rhodospirillaceae bacterium]|nr:nuclear transport factor 2 family protein [Rhodospirillaceae bacterium]